MSVKIELVVSGVPLDISDSIAYFWQADDGFGMAPLHRLTERGPMQDGVTDVGFRLDPRTISIVINALASTEADMWTRRAALLTQLKPTNTPLIFRVTTTAGVIYNLDTYFNGGLTFPSNDRFCYSQSDGFTLVAPDPTWYENTLHTYTYAAEIIDAMHVPTPVPTAIGGGVIIGVHAIPYTANWKTYPTVRITGPITSPVITNLTTGDKLDFTGITIVDGCYYELDLRYGYKTVLDNIGTNKVNELTSDSDLTTFAIEPDPSGVNAIQLGGSGVSAATGISISFYDRYIGI